jgi:hypothetical protein
MVTLKQRMLSLRMTPAALARRAKLSADTVAGVLDERADTAAPGADTLRRCLGLCADGSRLVSNRTFRKQAARRKARFVTAMVQGTMGVEAQGLDPTDLRKLQHNTYRRLLKASSAQLW